jgi:acylphosphatase
MNETPITTSRVVGAFSVFQVAFCAMTTARRFIISGDVQGVGFRYFACRAAERCGVTGTVRNLPDGTVEAVGEGEPSALDAFRDALARGPHSGYVDRVLEEPAPVVGRGRFEVIF